jgi:hypothetical protein
MLIRSLFTASVSVAEKLHMLQLYYTCTNDSTCVGNIISADESVLGYWKQSFTDFCISKRDCVSGRLNAPIPLSQRKQVGYKAGWWRREVPTVLAGFQIQAYQPIPLMETSWSSVRVTMHLIVYNKTSLRNSFFIQD